MTQPGCRLVGVINTVYTLPLQFNTAIVMLTLSLCQDPSLPDIVATLDTLKEDINKRQQVRARTLN